MTNVTDILNEIFYSLSDSLPEDEKEKTFLAIISVMNDNDIDLEEFTGIDNTLDEIIAIETEVDEDEDWEDEPEDIDEDE
jgi:hypothetical protein